MSKELILLGFASLSSRNGVSASKLGKIAVALGVTRQTTMVLNAFDGQRNDGAAVTPMTPATRRRRRGGKPLRRERDNTTTTKAARR